MMIQIPIITPHMVTDFLYYFAFLGGQLLFVLKRAAQAIRSKTNPTQTRREFIARNWDVLTIRMVIELPIYYGYRHYDLNTLLSLFTSFHVSFSVPQGPITAFMLGYLADSLLDWFGTSSKAPDWMKENIPSVQVFAAKSLETETGPDGATRSVEKTIRVEQTPPAPPPTGDSKT